MGLKVATLESVSDFDAWKVNIEALLVIKGCDDALYQAPEDHDTAARAASDRQAKAHILSYISPWYKKELAGMSAMEMWNRHRTTYRSCLLA
jgi:hypothetical protein